MTPQRQAPDFSNSFALAGKPARPWRKWRKNPAAGPCLPCSAKRPSWSECVRQTTGKKRAQPL